MFTHLPLTSLAPIPPSPPPHRLTRAHLQGREPSLAPIPVVTASDGTAGQPTRAASGAETSPPVNTQHGSVDTNAYRWIPGECLQEYGASAAKWKTHTSSQAFTDAFMATAAKFEANNEDRAEAIE